jgi:hypothetical protein
MFVDWRVTFGKTKLRNNEGKPEVRKKSKTIH